MFFEDYKPTSKEETVTELLDKLESISLFNLNIAREVMKREISNDLYLKIIIHITSLTYLYGCKRKESMWPLQENYASLKELAVKACMNDALRFKEIINLLKTNNQVDLDCAYLLVNYYIKELNDTIYHANPAGDELKKTIDLFKQFGFENKDIRKALKIRNSTRHSDSNSDLEELVNAGKMLEPHLSSDLLSFLPMISINPAENQHSNIQIELELDFQPLYNDFLELANYLITLAKSLPDTTRGESFKTTIISTIERGKALIPVHNKNYLSLVTNIVDNTNPNSSPTVQAITFHPMYESYVISKPLFAMENECKKLIKDASLYYSNYYNAEADRIAKLNPIHHVTNRRNQSFQRYLKELNDREIATEKQLVFHQRPSQRDTTSLATALHAHQNLFLQIFETPTPNKVIRFEDLCKIIEVVGGKVEPQGGSKYRIRLHSNTHSHHLDTMETVTAGAHAPHGHAHNNGKVLSYVVNIFKNALIQAEITPDRVWPQPTETKVPRSNSPSQ